MTTLQDYLGRAALKQLASVFATAAGLTVRIMAPDGTLYAWGGRARKGEDANPIASRIVVGGEHVGSVILSGPVLPPHAERMLGLVRDVLGRLCQQAGELRDRIEELATMYRLTEVFTGLAEQKEVYRLVAETMVKVAGADACSIRVFNEDRTELLTMAAYGLSKAYMAKGRILLADSQIDQEVITGRKDVYIADERSDPRVLYKAQARREGLVSALCAPMIYRGVVEGVIRVYTKQPHVFDWFESSLIHGVASQAAAAIVNARLYQEALRAEEMRRQLHMASVVQRRMIPARPPRVPGLELAAVYVPSLELGGDFYDFIPFAGDNLGICVADVIGKGLRASLLMASARSMLRAHAAHIFDLSRVLRAVNLDMLTQSQEEDFITMFYGVLDVHNRRLTYCSAGHEPALLLRGGEAEWLSCGGGVMGIDADMNFEHEVLGREPGDVLVVSTDGLPEALNFQDEPFGRQRVRSAALAGARLAPTAEGIARHLLWEMRRFSGLQTRRDDLTLVTVKVL